MKVSEFRLSRVLVSLPVLGLFTMLLLVCGTMFGQLTASAALQGTIADPNAAVIPDTAVTIVNNATGLTRSTSTGDTGVYRFELLPAGIYTVKVVKSGFATETSQKVELQVGRTSTQNFTLKPGAQTETVTVATEVPLIDTEKADVSRAVTPTEIENLPLNGRDFANLAYLAPGARPVDSYDPTKNRIAVFSVNGSSGRNVNVTVNGIDNKDNTVGGPVMQFPLEAIQEFNISTQRFSAANGRSEGAAVNVITKAGTNDYHGSLYLFDTETDLNAIDKLTADAKSPKKDFSRQQFGGAVGGPVRKDKDFLFFALERQREHTAIPVSATSLNELNLVKNLGAQPAPSIPTPYFDWRYTGRYDHRFNDHNNVFLTYSDQNNRGENDQSTAQNDLTAGNFTTNQLILSNLTLNSVLSPRLVNAATVGYQYWNNVIDSTIRKPLITFSDGTQFGTNGNVPQQSYQRKYQFKDDLSYTLGKHGLKTGFDYLWEPQLGGYFEFNSTLEIDFLDVPSRILSNTAKYPQGFATPGLVGNMSFSTGDPREDLPGGAKMFGLYFQDDWKATPRLTLNLGLRWDRDFNLIGGGAQGKSRTYQALKTIGSRFASRLPHDDNKDFSPRIGFAYDLAGNGRHVLRGGYGLYFGQTFLNIPLFMIQQANPTLFATVLSIASAGPTDTGADIVPGTNIPLSKWRFGVDPLPTLPPAPTSFQGGEVGRLMDPNYRNPYSEQFNAGYAFQINPSNVVELEYVHELAVHESKTMNINPKIPGSSARELDGAFKAAGLPLLSRIDDEQSIDRSRYDGLNLSYRRRLSHHVSLNTAYVLSRAVCYWCYLGAASFRNRPTDPHKPFQKSDFGFAPSDERHRWTLSSVIDLPWGFQIAPIMQLASARPYNGLNSSDILGFGQSGLARPAIVPVSNQNDLVTYATASTSTLRACLAAGTCTRSHFNSFRGSAFFQLDTRISKNIKFGERSNLKLMFQGFDLTNRANFGNNYDGTQNNVGDTLFKPLGYITPGGVVVPQSFRAEFGAQFSF